MSFVETTALTKIKALNKRLRAVCGGTSASKTISILIWLIAYCQLKENKVVSVVSETFPHLKRGAMRDFLSIMEDHNYFDDSRWNRSDYIYTFETGTKLEFFSADQSNKVRGPRRDVLFINEANNISFEVFTQLDVRTREIVWLDWNPINEFWWYTEVAPVIPHDFITLTYKDNQALEQSIVEAIEARKNNKRWWRVYGEGLLGDVESRIYTNWALLDDIPHEARLEGYGLDFGYTNDPTAIVAIYTFNGAYIFDEITYLHGLSNRRIADILLNLPRALVLADSAEPKSIDEIAGYGVTITGSLKGQGSVLQGIQFVQDQNIFVTKRSTNILKEYRNYLWMEDKEGKIINEPTEILNHAMDAIRYGMSRYFVDYTGGVFHPIDKEKVRQMGAISDFGGVPFNI